MRHVKGKPYSLKVRRCAACLIAINEYLSVFTGAKASYNTCLTELNGVLLNSMTNLCSNQAYVQGFDCKSITFKSAVSMIERMEIAESIYEGVVESSYQKLTSEDAKDAGNSRK